MEKVSLHSFLLKISIIFVLIGILSNSVDTYHSWLNKQERCLVDIQDCIEKEINDNSDILDEKFNHEIQMEYVDHSSLSHNFNILLDVQSLNKKEISTPPPKALYTV